MANQIQKASISKSPPEAGHCRKEELGLDNQLICRGLWLEALTGIDIQSTGLDLGRTPITGSGSEELGGHRESLRE